jgi:hypothetical protein
MKALAVGLTALVVGIGFAAGGPLDPARNGAEVTSVDPRIQQVIENISADSLLGIVQRLESFGTRDSRSLGTGQDRGIAAARDWILQEMRGYSPRLQVDFETYQVAPQGRVLRAFELRNVVAVLPGRSGRRIYVTAHFDSSARLPGQEEFDRDQLDFENFAPGANDNGSGTAVTMELARVLAQSGIEFDATLVFVAFAGEEQGLLGAILHADRARSEGLRIDAVYNSDIVGNELGGSGIVDGQGVRVFSEGPEDSDSRQLARFIQRVGARYLPGHEVRLVARADRFGRGGDHSAFNWAGFPAVRFTEPQENYARQHTIHDTSDGISSAYMARNAKVKASAVATQAMAPPTPEVNGPDGLPMLSRHPRRGYDAHLQWERSPGAVGYRVFWRDSWSANWAFDMEVGDVTELLLPDFSIDTHVLAVAAIGPGGHESVPAAWVRPPRLIEPVETVR